VQSYFFPAPYGKFSSSSVSLIDKLRGIEFPARISWILMEIPSFLVSLSALLHLLGGSRDWRRMLLLVPFTLHYLNRSLIFPLTLSKGRPFPLIASGSAFLFTLYNGLMQSHFIVSIARTEDLQPLLCLAGSVCFPCGMFINIQSDTILKNLRRDGETGYKIPYGGMFRFVSSPNYLGEIIEWIGFAMIVSKSRFHLAWKFKAEQWPTWLFYLDWLCRAFASHLCHSIEQIAI